MSEQQARQGIAESTIMLCVAIVCLAVVAVVALCQGYSEELIIVIITALAGILGFTGGALSVYHKAHDVLKKDRR
jgi:hypothetical protein